MLTKSFPQIKPGKFLLYICVGCFVLGNYSCKNNKTSTDMNSCLTLSKTELEKWFPGTGAATQISVIKFFPTHNTHTGTYSVIARAYNSGDTQIGNDLLLQETMECKINKLEERMYEVYLSELGITTGNTDVLIDKLESLILEPQSHSVGSVEYLKFKMAAVVNGATVDKGESLPCPPCANCRLPCPPPDECEGQSPCTAKIDTTQQRSTADTVPQ